MQTPMRHALRLLTALPPPRGAQSRATASSTSGFWAYALQQPAGGLGSISVCSTSSSSICAGVRSSSRGLSSSSSRQCWGGVGRPPGFGVHTWVGLQAQGARRGAWTDSRGYTHFDNGGGTGYTRGLLGSRTVQAAAAGTVAVGGLYWLSSREEIPYTHRRHAMMFVSKEREKALGQAMFKMTLAEAAANRRLLPSGHPYVAAVKRVGLRVAKAAAEGKGGGVFQHMRDVEWEFAVIDDRTPNAFVVPGGKVVVFTGLLELLGSEEELGAVLAHETGHVLARHHAERISSMNLWGIIKVLAWVFLGIGLPNAAFALGIFLPYSRLAEYEADTIGLQLMAHACFDPKAAVSMLQKLHEKEVKQPMATAVPAFMRTHPLTNERVRRVKEGLQAAYDTYGRAGCVGVAGFLRDVLPGGSADEFVFADMG